MDALARIYARLIIAGKLAIDFVPDALRAKVETIIEESSNV